MYIWRVDIYYSFLIKVALCLYKLLIIMSSAWICWVGYSLRRESCISITTKTLVLKKKKEETKKRKSRTAYIVSGYFFSSLTCIVCVFLMPSMIKGVSFIKHNYVLFFSTICFVINIKITFSPLITKKLGWVNLWYNFLVNHHYDESLVFFILQNKVIRFWWK